MAASPLPCLLRLYHQDFPYCRATLVIYHCEWPPTTKILINRANLPPIALGATNLCCHVSVSFLGSGMFVRWLYLCAMLLVQCWIDRSPPSVIGPVTQHQDSIGVLSTMSGYISLSLLGLGTHICECLLAPILISLSMAPPPPQVSATVGASLHNAICFAARQNRAHTQAQVVGHIGHQCVQPPPMAPTSGGVPIALAPHAPSASFGGGCGGRCIVLRGGLGAHHGGGGGGAP